MVLGGDLRFLNLPSPTSSDTSLASTVLLNQPDGGPPSPIPSSSSVASHSILPYLGWFIFVFFSSSLITNISRECLSCWHADSRSALWYNSLPTHQLSQNYIALVLFWVFLRSFGGFAFFIGLKKVLFLA